MNLVLPVYKGYRLQRASFKTATMFTCPREELLANQRKILVLVRASRMQLRRAKCFWWERERVRADLGADGKFCARENATGEGDPSCRGSCNGIKLRTNSSGADSHTEAIFWEVRRWDFIMAIHRISCLSFRSRDFGNNIEIGDFISEKSNAEKKNVHREEVKKN